MYSICNRCVCVASGLGTAALLCGLFLCGLPALVFGCLSLRRTEPLWRRFSRSRMSLVGLILGAPCPVP